MQIHPRIGGYGPIQNRIQSLDIPWMDRAEQL